MRVFAVSDLHLSGASPKPMDIFGQGWERHWDKIREDWTAKVTDEDLVVIGGDISWAMTLDDARVDLDEIEVLPGKKVLLRGNHDFWWSSLTKVNAVLGKSCALLQNNALRFGRCLVAGSRGWTVPGPGAAEQDRKIYDRELVRMELSLQAAAKLRQEGDYLLAVTHFPPFNEKQDPSEVTALLEKYGVDRAIYGHLHGYFGRCAFDDTLGGVPYSLTSCDHLDFKLLPIVEL